MNTSIGDQDSCNLIIGSVYRTNLHFITTHVRAREASSPSVGVREVSSPSADTPTSKSHPSFRLPLNFSFPLPPGAPFVLSYPINPGGLLLKHQQKFKGRPVRRLTFSAALVFLVTAFEPPLGWLTTPSASPLVPCEAFFSFVMKSNAASSAIVRGSDLVLQGSIGHPPRLFLVFTVTLLVD